MQPPTTPPRVLLIYYSLSGQSRGLVNLFGAGLRSQGVTVVIEQIRSRERVGFPFGSIRRTLQMMLLTFFQLRTPIRPPSRHCFEPYDLVVLAGPTWSYNPSGPVLSLLDRYGKRIFGGQRVLPLISCRGYYRFHDRRLRRYLGKFTDQIEDSLIFHHPIREPWSTIGVFLKAAGYRPERSRLLAGRYHHYGHTVQQLFSARQHGKTFGRELTGGITKNRAIRQQ